MKSRIPNNSILYNRILNNNKKYESKFNLSFASKISGLKDIKSFNSSFNSLILVVQRLASLETMEVRHVSRWR